MFRYTYHRNTLLRFALYITMICVLASCDSGSSSEQRSPEIKQRLQYQGLETSAVLTPDNVGEVLMRVLNVGTFSTEGLSVTSNPQGAKPSSMRRSEKAAFQSGPGLSHAKIAINENTICEGGGSFSLKGELNEMGIGKLSVNYDKCIIEDDQLHGTGLFNIRSFDLAREEPDQFVFEAEHMELISSSGRLQFSGTMDYTILPDREVVLNNLVLFDELNGLGYKLRNLEVTSEPAMHTSNGVVEAEEIRGRLYFSDLGFLDIDTLEQIHHLTETETLPVAGKIKISGDSNRFFIMDFGNKSIVSNLLNTETNTNYLADAELADLALIDLSDTDNDGMHLSFEQLMGLDPTANDGNFNDDGDLFTNREEYVKRSDLKNASSPPAPEARVVWDLKLNPAGETEKFFTYELGEVPALTYGDSVDISLTLTSLWASQTFEEFHGFEKLSITLAVPDGFEVTEFSSGDIECVHTGQILCTFPQYFNLDDDLLLFQAHLKINTDTVQGINSFNVRVDGFFTLDESHPPSPASVLVGWPLSAFQETFSRSPAQNEIKQVVLDQEVYWGSPTLEFSTKLVGSSADRPTKIYLSGDMLINHHDVAISGLEFFGYKEIVIRNSAPSEEIATSIKNNIFNRTKIVCDAGNVSLVGNLLKGYGVQIANGDSCDKLSVANNILINEENNFNLVGHFSKLEFVNNTVKGGGLGLSYPSSASTIQPDLFIANNIFLGGSAQSTVHPGVLHHIYMLDDYRDSSVVTNNLFEQADLYVESLQLSTQIGGSNLHLDNPGIELESSLFKILPGSLLIDKGLMSEEVGLTDYFGNPRNSDGDGDGESIPDIGAHEYILH